MAFSIQPRNVSSASTPTAPKKPSLGEFLHQTVDHQVEKFQSNIHSIADDTQQAWRAAREAPSLKAAAVSGVDSGMRIGEKTASTVRYPVVVAMTIAAASLLGPATPGLVLAAGMLGGSKIAATATEFATKHTIGSATIIDKGKGTDPDVGHALLHIGRAAAPVAGSITGAVLGAHNPLDQMFGIGIVCDMVLGPTSSMVGGVTGGLLASLAYGSHKAGQLFGS